MSSRSCARHARGMSSIIVAADLGVLGDAAAQLAATFGGSDSPDEKPTLGHPGAEAALGRFATATRDQHRALADQGAAGAATLRGFALAFHHAAG